LIAVPLIDFSITSRYLGATVVLLRPHEADAAQREKLCKQYSPLLDVPQFDGSSRALDG
jgi:hypothetical protein